MSQLKIECARRQLGTALELYLRDQDPISVHCLANGGCELIEFYAKKAGVEPMVSHILETNSDLKIEDVREMQRKYWNAFKHATKIKKKKRVEREDDELLQRFTDEHNDAALFVGWVDYARTTKMMPIEARVHHTWWITLNPDNVDPKISLTEYDRSFPQLREKTRAEQKQMLNRKIECVRMQKEHMEHPRTERRPLVLGWNTRE